MSVDLRQAALAVAKALTDGDGVQQSQPRGRRKPLVSTPKAMLLGAGLMAAGQMLVKTRGRAALQSVQHRLIEGPDDPELLDDDEEDVDEDEEYEDEPLDEEDEPLDEDDEPLDEEDEPVDEEDEEPRSSGRRASGAGRRRR